jgi:predicted dehydrogenase
MKTQKVKICFIGCGSHATGFIYPALLKVPTAEICAIAALDLAEAGAAAKRYGAGHSYSDYREMIENEKPEAVIIVGPPKLHYEAGKFCLERQIPFFIEKPPGENLEQATELAALSEKHRTFGQVGFMMRHSGIMRKAVEAIEKENLGRIMYGSVKYYTSGPYRSDVIYGMPGTDDLSYLWRYLMVQAVHPVNLAGSFLGKIVYIKPEVIFSGENILVNIKLKDDAGAVFDVLLHTFVAPGYGNLEFRTELITENRGMLFTDNFSSLKIYLPQPPRDYLEGGNRNMLAWEFATFGNNNVKLGFETEIASFVESVRTGTRPYTDLSDGLKTMQILTESFNQIKSGAK